MQCTAISRKFVVASETHLSGRSGPSGPKGKDRLLPELQLLQACAGEITAFIETAAQLRHIQQPAGYEDWDEAALDRFFFTTPVLLSHALAVVASSFQPDDSSRALPDSTQQRQVEELLCKKEVVCFVVEHAAHLLASQHCSVELGGGLVACGAPQKDLTAKKAGEHIARVVGLIFRLEQTSQLTEAWGLSGTLSRGQAPKVNQIVRICTQFVPWSPDLYYRYLLAEDILTSCQVCT